MCGRFVFVWSVTVRSFDFQKPHTRLICPSLPTLVFRFMSPQQYTTAQTDEITHSVATGQQTVILTDSCVCYLWAQTVSSLGYVIVCLGGLRLSVYTHTHPHTCAHTAYKWCLHLPTRPQLLWWQINCSYGTCETSCCHWPNCSYQVQRAKENIFVLHFRIKYI